jgi:hypothetical protein
VTHFYPTGPLQTQFQVSDGRKITSVRALRSLRDLPFKQVGSSVRFEVPSVLDYEVVALT